MRLTLDQVETLAAVVGTGSFAAASRTLNKVQSAISYDIRQMEERLGVVLFNREGYRAKLTPQGTVLFEEGRLLLARAKRMESLADRYREGWEPRLEAVIDGVLPTKPVMQALKTMADKGVPTRMQIKMEFLGGVQYRFEKDGADLMVAKDYCANPAYRTTPLPPVACVLVAANEHPLIQLGMRQKVSSTDLREFIQLSVHDSSESSGQKEESHLIGGSRIYYLSDFNTKHQGLLMGLGYGWMPVYMVQEDLSNGRLAEVESEIASRFHFTPHLVHPVDRPLGPAGEMFYRLLGENLAEAMNR